MNTSMISLLRPIMVFSDKTPEEYANAIIAYFNQVGQPFTDYQKRELVNALRVIAGQELEVELKRYPNEKVLNNWYWVNLSITS